MRTPHTPRHSGGPVFVDSSGRRLRRVRRAGWSLLAAAVAYAALVVTAALGGPSLQAPFLPQGANSAQTKPHLAPPTATSSTPSATGTSTSTEVSTSPSPTDAGTVERVSVTGATTATGATSRPTTTTPPTTSTGSTQPIPTPTASERGKSSTAPGATKRPTPTPKP